MSSIHEEDVCPGVICGKMHSYGDEEEKCSLRVKVEIKKERREMEEERFEWKRFIQ